MEGWMDRTCRIHGEHVTCFLLIGIKSWKEKTSRKIWYKWMDIKCMRNNEELNDLYSSPNIIWVIKSRMKWAGYVAHMENLDVG
jgi:hypothetical protein